MTISGAVFTTFRCHYLKEGTIQTVPEIGLRKKRTQSAMARKYFLWLERTQNVRLQYSGCGGEYVLKDGRKAIFLDAVRLDEHEGVAEIWEVSVSLRYADAKAQRAGSWVLLASVPDVLCARSQNTWR